MEPSHFRTPIDKTGASTRKWVTLKREVEPLIEIFVETNTRDQWTSFCGKTVKYTWIQTCIVMVRHNAESVQ